MSVNVLVNKHANPADRMLELSTLIQNTQIGFGLHDDEINALGQFAWACGSLDAWVAIGAVIVIGQLANRQNTLAYHWLANLSERASGSVRHTAKQYLNALGVGYAERS